MRCVLFPSLDLTITTAMNYKKSSSHCFFCQLFVQSFLISVARANDAVSHLSNVTPSFSYSKFHFKNCHFKYWSFDVEIYIEPLSFFLQIATWRAKCRRPTRTAFTWWEASIDPIRGNSANSSWKDPMDSALSWIAPPSLPSSVRHFCFLLSHTENRINLRLLLESLATGSGFFLLCQLQQRTSLWCHSTRTVR